MDMIKEVISKAVRRIHLKEQEMIKVMHVIMEGGATPAQISALLVALRMKGETVSEITAAAKVMREKAERIHVRLTHGEPLLDTCGTGGDGAQTFNVSTVSAFVVAGSGIKVAKHGNRSVSSKSGSADVLERLGLNLSMSPEAVQKAIEDIGIGFLFAPALHPAMKYAIGPRKEIGIRTIFNVLGPLTNPAGANMQILGVYSSELVLPLAEVLGRLGSKKAWVVHGAGGIDELSLMGESLVAEWDGKGVIEKKITPGDVGLMSCSPEDLKGGEPEENAKIMSDILAGEKGPKRDMVLLNAGAAIYLSGKAATLEEGIKKAEESIDSGMAMKKLSDLIKFGKSL